MRRVSASRHSGGQPSRTGRSARNGPRNSTRTSPPARSRCGRSPAEYRVQHSHLGGGAGGGWNRL